MNAELNKADAEFVASKVDAQLKVSDITKNVKINIPVRAKKSAKRVSLADWIESWEGDLDVLYKQARELCYVQHKRPDVLVDAIDALRSQARHQRQGIAAGRIASLPPDPQVAIARSKRLADEAAIARLDAERTLRDLTVEVVKCRHALQGSDFKLAAEARRQLTELNEHAIVNAQLKLKEATYHEEMMQLNYRSIRGDKFEAPGAAAYGSCER